MKNLAAVILAAGRGTRMKSDIPKVLHPILGRPIIGYVLDFVNAAGADKTVVVAGYKSELLKEALPGVKIVVQKRLLGSGDAVNTAKKALAGFKGDILVVCGDTPLLEKGSIRELIKVHRASHASATVLTAKLANPTCYGRIARDSKGKITRIVEETEATLAEKCISEINVGAYCFRAGGLFDALDEIRPDNNKSEYFLTDVIGTMHKSGKTIESVPAKDADTIIGINSRRDLAEAARILKERILGSHMDNGVSITDPRTTTIYPDVEIGRDTVIYPSTVIERDVKIGRYCHVGPFARLRGGVRLGDMVEVGNFVELVRTAVGRLTRIKHLSYLGDARVGSGVNIGAGTITANFDGKNKNKTVIGDRASIGVGAILIAPVEVGQGAVIGAGCVVPKGRNIPRGATVVGVPARILKRSPRRRRGI